MAIAKHHHPIWTLLAAVTFVAIGISALWARLPVIPAALAFYGSGIGLQSIARGTLPLAMFGATGYATLMGRLAMPSPTGRSCSGMKIQGTTSHSLGARVVWNTAPRNSSQLSDQLFRRPLIDLGGEGPHAKGRSWYVDVLAADFQTRTIYTLPSKLRDAALNISVISTVYVLRRRFNLLEFDPDNRVKPNERHLQCRALVPRLARVAIGIIGVDIADIDASGLCDRVRSSGLLGPSPGDSWPILSSMISCSVPSAWGVSSRAAAFTSAMILGASRVAGRRWA